MTEASWPPPPAPLAPEAQASIRRKFGLPEAPFEPLAGGFANRVYATGEFIVRVPRDQGAEIDALKEAVIYAALESAGLRTPRLVGIDTDRDALPFAYTVLTRVPGRVLDTLAALSAEPGPWREAGRELARFHALQIVAVRPYLRTPDETPGNLRESQVQRGLHHLSLAAASGAVDDRLAGRAETRLVELSEALEGPFEPRLIHNDIHGANLVVDPAGRLAAIVDFGDACISAYEREFAACPLSALPALLTGYTETTDTTWNEASSARVAALRIVRCLEDATLATAPGAFRDRWLAYLVRTLDTPPDRFAPTRSDTPT